MLIALFAHLLSSPAHAVPLELTHQGRLMDALGVPLDGAHDVDVAIFDTAAGGTALWSESFAATPFDRGYYSLDLGTGLDAATFDPDDTWLELTVDSGLPMPRIKLASVPYAIRAQNAASATSLSGGVVDASEVRINGTTVIDGSGNISGAAGTLGSLNCQLDEIAVFDGTAWGCGSNLPDHTHDAADIATGVLDILRLPVGTGATDVAAGDHLHALSAMTGQITDAQLPSDMDAIVDGFVVNGALDLDGGTTIGGQPVVTGTGYGDADAIAAVDTRRTVYRKLMTGTWLENNATFVRSSHSDVNGQLQFGTGAGGEEKLFEVPLVGAGTLDPATTWLARIEWWAEPTTTENDFIIGLADSTDMVGAFRLDDANNEGYRGREGADGNTLTAQAEFGTRSGDPGPTQRHGEVYLRLSATRTEVIAHLENNVRPLYGASSRVINADEALKLAVYSNEAGEQYGFYAIRVEIQAESP